MCYSVSDTGGYSFDFADVDGKGGVVPITSYLFSRLVDCWLDGGNFVSYKSSEYPSMSHSNKYRYSY